MNLNLNTNLKQKIIVEKKMGEKSYHCVCEAISKIFERIFDLITWFGCFEIFRAGSVALLYSL